MVGRNPTSRLLLGLVSLTVPSLSIASCHDWFIVISFVFSETDVIPAVNGVLVATKPIVSDGSGKTVISIESGIFRCR